jgi:hypothetical protein
MFLVGSTALNYYLPESSSKIRDLDIISLEKPAGIACDWSSLTHLNNAEICDKFAGDEITINERKFRLINPTGLFILKRSHLHRPIKFARHIMEFQRIKKLVNELTGKEKEVLARRTKLTKEAYGDKHPSLKMSNEEFFDDYVDKYFVHDDLHKVVAYNDVPVYEMMKKDQSQAFCEKSMFFDLPFEEQLNCVREESYVIALERYIIPKWIKGENHMPASFAFDKALERVCTTLTSGWFRDFAIDNWSEIRSQQVDFLGKFLAAEPQLKRLGEPSLVN